MDGVGAGAGLNAVVAAVENNGVIGTAGLDAVTAASGVNECGAVAGEEVLLA